MNITTWEDDYKRKVVSPELAAQAIKSGDNVLFPNVYFGILPHSIVARRTELRDVTIDCCAPFYDPGWFSPGMEESFNPIISAFLYAMRHAHDAGWVPFLPYTHGTWIKPHRDNRSTKRDIDVFIVEVSTPDENGFCYFGRGVWESPYFAKHARTVIAEVDADLVRPRGKASIHVSEIDYVVDVTGEPLSKAEVERLVSRIPEEKRGRARKYVTVMEPRLSRAILPIIDDVDVDRLEGALYVDSPTDVMKSIAENLKPILRDGDTIQIGAGSHTHHLVQLGVFDDLNDLSIFSEMASPGMGFLVERGIATGRYAELHPGKAVLTSFLGMLPDEMRWAGNNPLFELHPGEQVINITNIAKQNNMVAINNAVQVDLTGQITCESQFGPRLLNGAGGQIEFHIGAFLSHGGRAVTVLPSTWGHPEVSTIVPYFERGTLLTLSRYWADYVLTEWGVAELAGRTHRERAQELTRIAHPKFRDELAEAAKSFH